MNLKTSDTTGTTQMIRHSSALRSCESSVSAAPLRFIVLALTLLTAGLPVAQLSAAPAIIPRAPDIAATSYILIDAKT